MIIDTVVETVVETVVIQEEVNPTTIIITSETPQAYVGESEPGPQGIQGPEGPAGTAGPLEDATNVDSSNLSNGSLLIYSTSSQKWVASTLLENQSLESGHY